MQCTLVHINHHAQFDMSLLLYQPPQGDVPVVHHVNTADSSSRKCQRAVRIVAAAVTQCTHR
jgi:hypothetical protein